MKFKKSYIKLQALWLFKERLFNDLRECNSTLKHCIILFKLLVSVFVF